MSIPQQLKFIDIDGIKTYYRASGQGETVLLVHGLGANGEMWGKTVPYLSKKYRVIAPDLPGHGQSEKPDVPYGSDFYADFLIKFIEAIGLDSTVLVGVSMGSHAVIKVALRRPELISKIVMVSSSGLSPIFGGLFKIPGLAWLFTFAAGHWHYFDIWLYKNYFADKHLVSSGVLKEYLNRLKLPGAKRAYYRTLMSVRSAEKGYSDIIKNLKVPTLVVWGKDDKIMPFRDAYIYTELIKNSRLAVIYQCGHVPPVEKYREFNRVILDFLK